MDGKLVGAHKVNVKRPDINAITSERVEAALDKLAHAMMRLGPKGERVLPIYERLERELEALRVNEAKMASVRDQARRSKKRAL